MARGMLSALLALDTLAEAHSAGVGGVVCTAILYPIEMCGSLAVPRRPRRAVCVGRASVTRLLYCARTLPTRAPTWIDNARASCARARAQHQEPATERIWRAHVPEHRARHLAPRWPRRLLQRLQAVVGAPLAPAAPHPHHWHGLHPTAAHRHQLAAKIDAGLERAFAWPIRDRPAGRYGATARSSSTFISSP